MSKLLFPKLLLTKKVTERLSITIPDNYLVIMLKAFLQGSVTTEREVLLRHHEEKRGAPLEPKDLSN